MKTYLIDPAARTISEVEYDGGLEQAYKLIGCDTIEAVYLDARGNALFVDEEFLYKHDKSYFRIFAARSAVNIGGKALLVGTDFSNGETIAPSMTKEDLARSISWLVRMGGK